MKTKLKNKIPHSNYDPNFQLLFELSVHGIFIENKSAYILDCNKAGLNMFGFSINEIAGKHLSELLLNNFVSESKTISSGNYLTDDKYIECLFKKKDGTIFTAEICSKYAIINNEECIITFIHDISAQKKIQNELIESKKTLEKVLTTRDKFFSIISHDLKSPMQSILGFADLIDNEIGDASKELKLYVRNLKKSANSSAELLENLLNWTICQSKEFKPLFEMVEIKSICEEDCNLYLELAQKKNIAILKEIDEGIKIKTDKNMLQFIMRNLVTNAIKFTNENGQIQIIVSQTQNATSFIVKDNGVGIDESKIEKILNTDIFYSTTGTSNETGTGLGLKTCIEFLKILNSELKIQSIKNIGSIFGFNLPNK